MDIGPIDVGLSKDVEVIPHVFIYNMIVYIYIYIQTFMVNILITIYWALH